MRSITIKFLVLLCASNTLSLYTLRNPFKPYQKETKIKLLATAQQDNNPLIIVATIKSDTEKIGHYKIGGRIKTSSGNLHIVEITKECVTCINSSKETIVIRP